MERSTRTSSYLGVLIQKGIPMIIVGVDPGVKGCVTILNTYAYREVISLPMTHNTLKDIYLFLSEVKGGEAYGRAKHVLAHSQSLHKVQSGLPKQVLAPDKVQDNTMEMWLEEPGQIVVKGKDSTGGLLAGMASSRKLGRSVGQWEGIAAALDISVNLLSPKKWQSRLNCKTGGNKNISKKAAIRAFSFLTDRKGKSKITHDIADSLLIALYGYLEYTEPKYIPLSFKSLIGDTNESRTTRLPRTSRTGPSSTARGRKRTPPVRSS